jgi:hypothetical protein
VSCETLLGFGWLYDAALPVDSQTLIQNQTLKLPLRFPQIGRQA